MFIDQSSANSSNSNGTEKKCYDISLLKKIKDDPLSKGKPDIPLLEELNVLRSTPIQDHAAVFETMIRPHNDTLLPSFAKSPGMGSKSLHDNRKDGRNMGSSGGRGSMKMSGNSRTPHKPVVHLSLLSSENVKLNETENAWRPSRLKKDNLTEEEEKTQELYKKFRGILNKLTPQKFKTLLEKVKTLEINNQKRLEGVIDLVFEKAIEEPNFSEAYALMCAELSTLKVPADKTNAASDGFVNFRVLIITKCQNQFVTKKSDEQILKLEKECNDCTDPAKKKELQLQLDEENRKVRMRSVGNVRFIGELYKLKMLTAKIMVFCMNYLIEKLEEENLECLCKLLTTIGQQIESEAKGQLDSVFKKMQDIVSKKTDKISSRVRFMLQDVIELRLKNWQGKNVIDSKPKLMGQIQKEAEQRQRDIELMNANPGGGYRRDDGGRGNRDRLDNRRSQNTFADNNAWKTRTSYKVDSSKLKAFAAQNTKNVANIKLAPQNRGWNHGSGTRTTQPGSLVNLTTNNVFSVLENVQADPISITGNKEELSYQPKGASIEGSSLKSRNDITSGNGGGRSRSMVVPSTAEKPAPEPSKPLEIVEDPTSQPISQEPLPETKKKSVKSMIDLCLINPDDSELVGEVKHLFTPQYHAGLVSEILNIALEKSSNDLDMISKSLLHLVATNTISADNLLEGLNEILEFAPDLYIDVPLLYDHLGRFIAPQIERKHITLAQILKPSATVISSNQGHLFLKAIIKELKNSMGPSFVKTKWQESGLELNQWMEEDQVSKWLEENQFQFLLGNSASEETKEESIPAASEETKKELSPAEVHSKLVQLMKSDESIETIKGWIQDNVGSAQGEEWFLRALSQAACAQALAGTDAPLLAPERLCKYSELLLYGERPQSAKEATCLFAIQHLIHRLEHPQGLTVELFQYLHENYIISVEGFVEWEQSDKEPEGKAVMLKALTSFFTNIKEADNEESGSDE